MNISKSSTILITIVLSIILLCQKKIISDERALFLGIYVLIILSRLSIKFVKFTFEFSNYCKNNCPEIYSKYRGRAYLFKDLHSVEFFKIANSDIHLISNLNYRLAVQKIKNELKTDTLVILPRKGLPISSTWKLVWHKDKTPSPVAHAFMTYVTEHLDEIKKKHFE